MDWINKLKWTFRSIPFTVLSILVCIIAAGAGHGTYLPATFLFPYSMLTALWEGHIGALAQILTLIQFTAYGLTADLTRGKKRGLIIGVLIIIHFAIATVVYYTKGESF